MSNIFLPNLTLQQKCKGLSTLYLVFSLTQEKKQYIIKICCKGEKENREISPCNSHKKVQNNKNTEFKLSVEPQRGVTA